MDWNMTVFSPFDSVIRARVAGAVLFITDILPYAIHGRSHTQQTSTAHPFKKLAQKRFILVLSSCLPNIAQTRPRAIAPPMVIKIDTGMIMRKIPTHCHHPSAQLSQKSATNVRKKISENIICEYLYFFYCTIAYKKSSEFSYNSIIHRSVFCFESDLEERFSV